MTKNKQKIRYKTSKINHSFTAGILSKYAGVSPIMDYINKLNIGKELNEIFPTEKTNAAKFSNIQIILALVLASLSGVKRAIRISNFTSDSLVKKILNLGKNLNKDVIGQRIKKLGWKGSVIFQEYTYEKIKKWVSEQNLKEITIDCDSTVQTVYGNQQGAAKGYNPQKKGAKSYHSLLAFISELKIVINNRFRTGSAYTSNGIISFIKQTKQIIPEGIIKVFFRADSGFFNGLLCDLLEELQWEYLIKVKLKNLGKLLSQQQWTKLSPEVSICEFFYKAKGWNKQRKLKAIRTITNYVTTEYFGKTHIAPIYEYACYCSSLENNAEELHEKYKERATSENWIEQIKNQLLAGKTLTNDFYANDLLWQIGVFAYNLSVMMRYKVKKYWRQEHNTFRDWFIELPAKITTSGKQLKMQIYEKYYFRSDWENFEKVLLI
jgi:hypothetical protein